MKNHNHFEKYIPDAKDSIDLGILARYNGDQLMKEED